jgi:hypothetical protein
VSDKPIHFSAPMLRAILDGRKTQTRRVTLPLSGEQAKKLLPGDILISWPADQLIRHGATFRPRYTRGDRLWVREAWRSSIAYDDLRPSDMGGEEPVHFEADGSRERWTFRTVGLVRLRAAMHMPRWASRLTLTVTDVRVQRLQDISDEDAEAEGIEKDHAAGMPGVWGWHDYLRGDDMAKRHFADPRESYRTLWDSLNAKRGFGSAMNPWIAAYTFTVDRRNIHAMPASVL